MGAPKDPITGLTVQQDAFAHAVASGLNYSDAYRSAYNVSPDTLPTTIMPNASRLAADRNVLARIQAIKEAADSHAARAAGWDRQRLISEAETQLSDARTGGWRGVASGNGALEIIARVTGLLQEKPRDQAPVVTHVTVVLNHGVDAEGRPRIVEAEARTVLGPADEREAPQTEP